MSDGYDSEEINWIYTETSILCLDMGVFLLKIADIYMISTGIEYETRKILHELEKYCTNRRPLQYLSSKCNIFLYKYKISQSILFISGYFIRYRAYITKIKEMQFRLFGGHFRIMRVQYP